MADQLICQCRKRLSKAFEVEADLRIPLAQSPVTVLFGPSGSGKTTLLRMLAGLERPDAGSIVFRDVPWFDDARAIHLPPQQRRAGFLFQDYALFPHLTVAENIAYAASPEIARKLLDTFGLADLAARKPRAISGGQQQRVALARALAAEPALLLLDEPLSALDAPTRSRTRYELRRLLLSGGVPSIVVTHDRMEAVALGDWMAVMVDGRIRQTGPVQEVFRKPADLQVAESVGVENVLAAEIVGRESGLLVLQVSGDAGGARIQCVDSGETGSRLRLHPRRGRRHHAADGSGIERAQPTGGMRAVGCPGRRAGARRTRLRVSAGGDGHFAIRRGTGAARGRDRVRRGQSYGGPPGRPQLPTIELMAKKESPVKTNAARILDAAGIHYELREYTVDEDDLSAPRVAEKIGMPPEQVFKTLVARGDRTGVLIACIPANTELDLKALAAASGNKKVELVAVKEVLGLTGYIRGGVSPIGTRKPYPFYLDETAILWDVISVSAGVRGCQMVLAPDDLTRVLDARSSAIANS